MVGNLGKAGPGQLRARDHIVLWRATRREGGHGVTVPRGVAASWVTPGVTSYCCGMELEKPLALGWKINDVEGRVTGLIPSSWGGGFLPFFEAIPTSPQSQLLRYS